MQMNKKKIKKELENDVAVQKCAEEFRMVGDPTRLKICYLLCQHKELSVSDISDVVGVSISAVSHTLRKLKNINIVHERRDFRHVYYHLSKSSFSDLLRARINISL